MTERVSSIVTGLPGRMRRLIPASPKYDDWSKLDQMGKNPDSGAPKAVQSPPRMPFGSCARPLLRYHAVDKQGRRFDNGRIDNHFQEVWSVSKESQTLNASKNMRLTKGSQKVLEALASNRNLATAQDIHGTLREKDEEAPGLTTVYRSLESLVGLGLVQSVEFGDGEKRFEIVEPGEHHHHLVCEKCGDSVHLDQCLVEDLESAVKTKYGFEIRTHILEIFGLCKKCH